MTSLDAPDPLDRETLGDRLRAARAASNGNGSHLAKAAENDITRLAEKFKAQGLDENEVSSALINLNYSPAQVRKALATKTNGKELVMANEEKKPWKLDVDWKQVQRDRDARESVESIAKRLNVHASSVYGHTKGSAKNRVEKSAKAAKPKNLATASNGNGANGHGRANGEPHAPENGIDWAIGALLAKRDRLDLTIKTLEELRAGELT